MRIIQAGMSAVFVSTFGAGGVGLTLTAASTIILLDRPWTAGDAMQAEDRVRRIGQTKEVTSIWLKSFPIDDQIDNMIEQKKATSSAVVDGRENNSIAGQTTSMIGSAPKISIMQLISSVLSGSNGNQVSTVEEPQE